MSRSVVPSLSSALTTSLCRSTTRSNSIRPSRSRYKAYRLAEIAKQVTGSSRLPCFASHRAGTSEHSYGLKSSNLPRIRSISRRESALMKPPSALGHGTLAPLGVETIARLSVSQKA